MREALEQKAEVNIIVATGASQFDLFEQLLNEPDIDWHRVRGFHLDEYIGMPLTHPASFRKYLWERFISRLPVPLKAFHYIDGMSAPNDEIEQINQIIAQHPVDVAFIGIGENAHVAFNDPPADFETNEPYILVDLDDACRTQQFNEGWFPRLDDVPKIAISMSINHIMKSKTLICTVPDARKATAVHHALNGPVTPDVPASILQQHPACHYFFDTQSAALLQEGGNSR